MIVVALVSSAFAFGTFACGIGTFGDEEAGPNGASKRAPNAATGGASPGGSVPGSGSGSGSDSARGDAGLGSDSNTATVPIAPAGPPGCGLANAAFCEDVTAASPGGRGSDLDDARWSVSRVTGEYWSPNILNFPSTPVSACKTGVTSAIADSDILFCDAASGHLGQFVMVHSAQNYAFVSMRPRQAFDFAGRTGTIAFNVDAVTQGGLSWWTSLFVTEDPQAGANNTSQVTGEVPRNGVGVNFDDNCNINDVSKMRINGVFTYANYVETFVPIDGAKCVATQRGKLNHIEVRLAQTSIEVWASDFSPDGGVTFPNFQKLGSAAINLPFSRGYVHYQQAERAPIKYEVSFGITQRYAANYWAKLGFDGPVLPPEVAYAAPDALTPNGSGVNLGYAVHANQSVLLSVPNVKTTAASAELAFTVSYTWGGNATPANNVVHYRLNGGTWRAAQTDVTAATRGQAWGGDAADNWAVAYMVPVDVGDLRAGSNDVEVSIDNASEGYPPILGNLELRTR
jgi:hypothetical protein